MRSRRLTWVPTTTATAASRRPACGNAAAVTCSGTSVFGTGPSIAADSNDGGALAVFEDGEIGGREAAHRPAVTVEHRHVDGDEVDAAAAAAELPQPSAQSRLQQSRRGRTSWSASCLHWTAPGAWLDQLWRVGAVQRFPRGAVLEDPFFSDAGGGVAGCSGCHPPLGELLDRHQRICHFTVAAKGDLLVLGQREVLSGYRRVAVLRLLSESVHARTSRRSLWRISGRKWSGLRETKGTGMQGCRPCGSTPDGASTLPDAEARADYASSHVLRVMPACRRMTASSPTPMSRVCGLGTVRTVSRRTMNWWRPPEYGPAKPRRLSAAMSFRREIGPHFGISWRA